MRINNHGYIGLLLGLLCFGQAVAQNNLADLADPLSQQGGEAAYTVLYERLQHFASSPLDLNQSTRAELASLKILSSYQLLQFFQYQAQYGPLKSLYELQAIPGWDVSTIKTLLPFVRISTQESLKSRWQRIKTAPTRYLLYRVSTILQPQKGYAHPEGETPAYRGSPFHHYVKFRLSRSHDVSAGLTAEKDRGEAWGWDPAHGTYGPDYLSFHLEMEQKGLVKRWMLGDYQLQYGQGLLLGAGFHLGKSAQTVQVARPALLGIQPYTSSLETGYLRGAAATLSFGQWQLTPFVSYRAIDGSAGPDSLDRVTSLLATGYHRTATEYARKSQIDKTTGGVALGWKSKRRNLQVGTLGLYQHLSKALVKTPRLYNQYDFKGNVLTNWSLFSSYYWENFHFFGEVATALDTQAVGEILGFTAAFNAQFESSLLWRHYPKDFHSLEGQAFGQYAHNQNEEGLYLGLRYQPFSALTLHGYVDLYHSPWLRFRTYAPSAAEDYFAQAHYQFDSHTTLRLSFHHQDKWQNAHAEKPQYVLSEVPHNQWRLQLKQQISKPFALQTQLSASTTQVDQKTHKGLVLAEDVNYQLRQWKFSTRFALFQTDGYAGRQYLYEHSVRYAFSIPAYFGKGVRTYAVIKYKPFRKLSLWAKVANTRYLDQSTIGSGYEEIKGHQKTSLSVEGIYNF